MLRTWTNFTKFAKQKRTATAVRNRLDTLKQYWETAQTQYAQLCALVEDATRKTHVYFAKDKFLAICDDFEEICDVLSDAFEALQPSYASVNPNDSQVVEVSRTTPVQLPRIEIPKFSGDITNNKWEIFRDIFQSLVGSRMDLTNVQKLQYLKANLSHDTSLVLTNLQVTDANYTTAWDLLCKRYDNSRAIVNAHLQAFLEIPSVASQSAVRDLKNLGDKTHDIYTALLNLKRPVNKSEELMIFITVSKLDKVTRRDWEISLGDSNTVPNFAELDGFLTSRLRVLEAINTNERVANNDRAPRMSCVRAHQSSANEGICGACDGNHPTYRCKAFVKLTVDKRIELLKHNKCCLIVSVEDICCMFVGVIMSALPANRNTIC